jgi:hypothetical protein
MEHLLLAQFVAYAGLVAATAEYAAIVRRREWRRRADADRLAAESGLTGLVRVMLVDR